MKNLALYLKTLQQLRSSTPIKVEAKIDSASLMIEGVPFIPIPHQFLGSFVEEDPRGKGILLPSLSLSERQVCRDRGVSYLTLDGSFFLFQKNLAISIEPVRKQRPRSRKLTKELSRELSPTLVISPNSLPILDMLFFISENELKKFKSALSFAQRYSLYQPKLSKLMRAFRAKNLVELRNALTNLSEDWWKLALQYPATKKGLTPFFHFAKPFHGIDVKGVKEATLKSFLKERRDLVLGPVEIAKEHSLISDADKYFWGPLEALQELKRKFRLVPGASNEGITWYLASPSRDLKREAIITCLGRSSVFRAIWDLSFGSERLREIRINLLRKVLHGDFDESR